MIISFYKVDLENQPFDPNAVCRLAIHPQKVRRPRTSASTQHDVRTKQLLAISRGEPPPIFQRAPSRAIPPRYTRRRG
eukprot:scaffold5868_cov120-Isochrysis_galbana.AAC.17